ncbi:hypothetical protein [Streptomyces sp. HNM0574]|uniref:hypothetical protein n=1 Tax=Streptomyces sp. HNM0574 TaxID=2714954 RepID=UPI00146C16B3|nr:hypothetical protein [Streptomyces sp. HNM0574]NLU66486.1 hypothetical protein [Streptomyces sp. HNM0574]
MNPSPDPDSGTAATTAQPVPAPRAPGLRRRLAELRGGPSVPPRPLDARALAALAANPGCHRRALLDGAGVDKGAVAEAMGAPASFGQSQFALVRGNAFEAKVKGDGSAGLMALLCARTGEPCPEPSEVRVPELTADGPAGRTERTRLALEESAGGWALLDHPMLALDVAGTTAYLEPDALAVHPDGSLTVVEIKSFPILDGAADPAKVGAAARQAAVYALALERSGLRLRVREQALLVCPKDFSNVPTADHVDLRKPRAATRRQLDRLTRVEDIAAALPDGISFDPARPPEELRAAVDTVPAAYAPECLAGCELAFHCRSGARAEGAVESLGRSVRGELGGLRTVGQVLEAAAPGQGEAAHPDPAVAALRRAARLRAEALAGAAAGGEKTEEDAPCR